MKSNNVTAAYSRKTVEMLKRYLAGHHATLWLDPRTNSFNIRPIQFKQQSEQSVAR